MCIHSPLHTRLAHPHCVFTHPLRATKGMLQFYEQKKMSVVSINLRYVNMTIPVYIHVLKDGVASDY